MSISMYQASIPVFVRMLGNLKKILEKGEAYAREREIDEAVLINARLAPDMFPLVKQIQIACDVSKRCAERLADMEVTSVEDNEKTFTELYQRINNTITFLETINAEQIDNTEDKKITMKLPGDQIIDFTGMVFLLNFVLPNVYFHVTTAYDILRHNGVVLGKRDFIGEPL